MNIWIIRDLEPLPTDVGGRRLLRAAMLSQAFSDAGHRTTWFTSSFDHYQKRQRSSIDKAVEVSPNLTIQILQGNGYRHNVSLARILHNLNFARAFRRFADSCSALPDVLVTDIPTTEAAKEVISFGKKKGIPTILSIRDLWPDFFVDFVPPLVRPLAKLAIRPFEHQTRFACRHATSLIGISPEYLKWGQQKGGRFSDIDRVFPLGYTRRQEFSNGELIDTLRDIGVTKAGHLVSFVGSWGLTYDIELIYQAALRLIEHPDITFVVAGNAASRPDLELALRKLPNVVLPGWIDATQIAALLSASDIGLLPYSPNAPQGLPNKVFEYMAYGAFQISTLGGEIQQFYEQTKAGRVVERSPDLLAASILGCLQSQSNEVERKRRIAVFEANYSAEVIYSEMVNHVLDIAGKQKEIVMARG